MSSTLEICGPVTTKVWGNCSNCCLQLFLFIYTLLIQRLKSLRDTAGDVATTKNPKPLELEKTLKYLDLEFSINKLM